MHRWSLDPSMVCVVLAISGCQNLEPPEAAPADVAVGRVADTTVTPDATVTPKPQPTPGLAPISGGTLAISADGLTAVAADSERDQVYVVDLIDKAAAPTVVTPAKRR